MVVQMVEKRVALMAQKRVEKRVVWSVVKKVEGTAVLRDLMMVVQRVESMVESMVGKTGEMMVG